jgi:predicted amidohydrolase
VLIRARAVEGQFFVVAPAQSGRHNAKFTSYGHSMLVDPWGKVVAMAPPGPGLVYGHINLAYLEQNRPLIGDNDRVMDKDCIGLLRQ